MRLLHTSDWHLGRTLHGFSLREAQESAVDAVVALAIDRDVDAVVVAGDVFDRAVPPVESLRLLNAALTSLNEAGITVILTAGNHDSGDRLATYAALLREGVRIVGSTSDVGAGIEIPDEHGPVVIYALPYLEPDFARHDLAVSDEPLERSHEAVMRAALDRISDDLAERDHPRAVAVGHAFVIDSATRADDVATSSERDLAVGGVQVVPAELFEGRGIDYVALGHLHRPREVRPAEPMIAYSGSLLRYSLSEANDVKSVVIIEVGPPGAGVSAQRVEVPQSRGMARLRGTIDELTGDDYAVHRDAFVELVVVDAAYPDRMHARLDAAFPYALVKLHEPAGAHLPTDSPRGDARGREPLDVMADFLRKVTGREPTDAESEVLRQAYETARTGSR